MPTDKPVTVPAGVMVAMGEPVLHAPPATVSAIVIVAPVQTPAEPVITPALGIGSMVSVAVCLQPVAGNV